ncbi:MAG: PepSY-like domain-containing protein [Ferruginibacter sp.]
MKKLIVLSAMTVFISFIACAQKLDASTVPADVKTSFGKAHPGVAAKWEKENGKYEVNFKQNGNTMSVLIDEKGKIIETETDIKVADLPAAVLAYVKVNYKGKPINEGAMITKAGGTVNYEAEVSGKDVIFDANGKFLKEVKN